MATTPNLGLTMLEASQKDKVATINTNYQTLDDVLPSPAVVATSDPPTMTLAPGSVYYNSVLKIVKMYIDGAWKPMGPPYLGDSASDPATTALPNGSRYYNTTSNVFKTLRNGSWVNG